MRRKDREVPREYAEKYVDKCEWATLAMMDPQGRPYCVPVSIARDGGSIYFHCAMDGLKVQCMRQNPQVCIACVGDTRPMEDRFATEYESTIIRGDVREVLDTQEKIHALKLICLRHTPKNMHNFDREIEKDLARTGVWKVTIREISGKRLKYGADSTE